MRTIPLQYLNTVLRSINRSLRSINRSLRSINRTLRSINAVKIFTLKLKTANMGCFSIFRKNNSADGEVNYQLLMINDQYNLKSLDFTVNSLHQRQLLCLIKVIRRELVEIYTACKSAAVKYCFIISGFPVFIYKRLDLPPSESPVLYRDSDG